MALDQTSEVVDLWTAVFGSPPALRTDVHLMIDILVSCLPPAALLAGAPSDDPAGEVAQAEASPTRAAA